MYHYSFSKGLKSIVHKGIGTHEVIISHGVSTTAQRNEFYKEYKNTENTDNFDILRKPLLSKKNSLEMWDRNGKLIGLCLIQIEFSDNEYLNSLFAQEENYSGDNDVLNIATDLLGVTILPKNRGENLSEQFGIALNKMITNAITSAFLPNPDQYKEVNLVAECCFINEAGEAFHRDTFQGIKEDMELGEFLRRKSASLNLTIIDSEY